MSSKIKITVIFMVHNLEAFIWIAVLLYFAISPLPNSNHFTICPLSLAGFQHCPGCGLGRSIMMLLHGHISESTTMHPLGLFAIALLIGRVFVIFSNYSRFRKQLVSANNQT
ncbi:MAG: DUF2752 domain-containing protein [Bacteroidales bacterium]